VILIPLFFYQRCFILFFFLFVWVRGTILLPLSRYDHVVWVVCSLLFPFYPKEVDDLIIGSSKVRFPEGGLFYETSSRNMQSVSVLC